MNAKEKIKEFNQRCMTLLNNIPEDSRPSTNVLLEFYPTSFPSSIAIFVKREAKNLLHETMQETLDVEMEMMNIASKSPVEDKRALPLARSHN
jgi:hypothetical protein